jgi:hypothetical protein
MCVDMYMQSHDAHVLGTRERVCTYARVYTYIHTRVYIHTYINTYIVHICRYEHAVT